MRYTFTFCLFLLSIWTVNAQTTLSGNVYSNHNQPVAGASVSLENTLDGATTDSLGHFSFMTNEKGNQVLIISAIGFGEDGKPIDLNQPAGLGNLKIILQQKTALKQVTITAGLLGTADGNGKTVLDPLDVVTTAGSGADPVQAMQMLPGVQKDGTQTGMLVRGGDASEAAFVVDGLRVTNPFFSQAPGLSSRSRFNAFQFKGISFSSGGYSARYGQAMSSVLEMNTLDLPDKNTVNVGWHMAGVYVSGDKLFHDNQMSLSATASYLNLSPFYKIARTNFDFYDVPKGGGGSLNYIWKTQHKGILKALISYSHNKSGMRIPSPFEVGQLMNYGNKNDHIFGQASFKQQFGTHFGWFTAFSYSYDANETKWSEMPSDETDKGIQARTELRWMPVEHFQLLAGLVLNRMQLEKEFDTLKGSYTESLPAAYLEAEWHPVYWLAIKAGGRLEHSSMLATTTIAPRLSASVRTGNYSQASIAGGIFYQDPEQMYLWQGYTNLKQQFAIHYIANWMYSQSDRTFRVEAYYKDYKQLVREHSSYFDPNDYRFIDDAVDNSGYGYADGFEVFLRDKKTVKNLDFWVSYSYINTKRLYQNFPVEATPGFISTHNLSVVTKYWIDDIHTMVSGTYNYASGKPYYDPQASVFLKDLTPAYHNLALQASYLTSIRNWFMVLYAGVDNVLNRKNIFGYRYSANGDQRYPMLPALNRSVFVGVNFSLTKFSKDEL